MRGLHDDLLPNVQYFTGSVVASTRPRVGDQDLLMEIYYNVIGYLDENGFKSNTPTDRWVGKDSKGNLYLLTGLSMDNPTINSLTLSQTKLQPQSENPCPCTKCEKRKVYQTRYLSKTRLSADDVEVKVRRKKFICGGDSTVKVECEEELKRLKSGNLINADMN